MVGIEGGVVGACGSYAPSCAHVQTAEDDSPARPGRIPLVDDDSGVRSAYRRILEAQGYTVDVAEDGKQALELLADTFYDAVLSDIMMPEMSGLEFLKATGLFRQ